MRLARSEQPVISQIATPAAQPTAEVSHTYVTAQQLQNVFATAKYWFWIVGALHLIPLYFIYINVVPTYRRWKQIHRKLGSERLADDVLSRTELTSNSPRSIGLYDKNSKKLLAPLTERELQLLIHTLEEEHSEDRDYYVDNETLELLKRAGMDQLVLQRLERKIRDKGSIEIVWSDD